MPENTEATMKLIEQEDQDRKAILQNTAAAATPMFDKPVRAREFNVTVEMLERVINDLSGGQVEAKFERASGVVKQLPPDVVLALEALSRFAPAGLEIDVEELASVSEDFAELASHLSEWRNPDAVARRGRAADEPRPTDGAATVPEQRALAARDEAAGIAADVARPARGNARR